MIVEKTFPPTRPPSFKGSPSLGWVAGGSAERPYQISPPRCEERMARAVKVQGPGAPVK